MIKDNPIKLDIKKPKSDIKPYDYQERAIERLEQLYIRNKQKSSILQIPTGGGKTLTAVRWIFDSLMHQNYKVVWIAHRIDLLVQARATMISESGHLKGLSKAPRCIIIGGDYSPGVALATAKEEIILLSSHTLAKSRGHAAMKTFCRKNRLNKILFVIDEAHHSAASSLKIFIRGEIDKEVNWKLLGLTATPTRTVERERGLLMSLFSNNIITEVSTGQLIKAGHLALPKPEKISTNIKLEEAYTITEETKQYFEKTHELDLKFLEEIGRHPVRNKLIVGTYLNKKEIYGKTLVFAINIAHAETLKTEFMKHQGIRVAVTHSGVAAHTEIVRQFADDELDILINVSKLTEGFDDPKIQTVFLTRPTQSEILFTQMIGRGLRGGVYGTKEVHLVSFDDHWKQFTGWLDAEKYINIIGEELEEEEDFITITTATKKAVTHQVIDELYRQIQTLSVSELMDVPPFECWPLGWFTLRFESDPSSSDTSVPVERTIIVFSHQKESWDALCRALKNAMPTTGDREGLYNMWFADLPTPYVTRVIFDLFIDSCYATGVFVLPEYHSVENREEASTEKIARILYDKSIGGRAKQDYINSWYQKYKLLSDIYHDVETFTEAVDNASRRISFPDKLKMTISAGPQYLTADKSKYSIPETSNEKLADAFNSLKENIELFPEGFDYSPSLEWTQREMKSYFGMSYVDERINKIKINRILNSPDIERNEDLISFTLYHEMLHFSVSQRHNAEFRHEEARYPEFIEMNSLLSRIAMEYEVDVVG